MTFSIVFPIVLAIVSVSFILVSICIVLMVISRELSTIAKTLKRN